MAHNERATHIRSKLTAAVAAGSLLVPGAASAKPKGLYASVHEGSYAAAATLNDGVSCEGKNKGGSVVLRPGNVPSTIRVEVKYPPVAEECTIPEDDSTGFIALKSLTTTVYKVKPNGRGEQIARVDVYGNGSDVDNIGVHKRTRFNTGEDLCASPGQKFAVIAKTDRLGDDHDILPSDAPASPLGEIANSTVGVGHSFDISEAEIFTPKC